MNLKDPETMNSVIGNVLRYGVVLSAVIVLAGVIQLAGASGSSDTGPLLAYNSGSVPHGDFPVTLPALVAGLESFDAYALIELGVIVLIATPVSRVLISVFLFAAESDRLYVLVTAVVLALLLFSMLATPFIPGFNA